MNNAMTVPGSTRDAMDAFLSETEGMQGLLLPTVKIGEGVFVPLKGNDPKDMDRLPDGGKARPAVFIAERTGVLAWKTGYDDKTKAAKEDGSEAPAFTAFSRDDADVALMGKASKARQFYPRDKNKADWDFANSKVGHVKPLKEFLVFLPDVGFAVVAHGANYHDVVDATLAVKSIANPDTGEVEITPVLIKAEKKHHKSKAWEWDANFCSMTRADEKTAASLNKAFAEYSALIKENPIVKGAVDSWLNCHDRPMTDDIRAALNRAVALNPPKF